MGIFTEKSALLIVDMINDFVELEGVLPVPGAKDIVSRISSLADDARNMGIPVIYANDSHDPDDKEFEKWPPHAISGTGGASVVEGLEPRQGDHVLPKKKFSAFFETGLDDLLKEKGVDHLVITGTVTNICVYASALDASMRGYGVTVPADAVIGLTDQEHQFALRQVEQVLGGEVVR